jgi:hypothetical protein
LQRLSAALSALIEGVHDARVRYPSCQGLRPNRLSGLSRFLREVLDRPHGSDYKPFERQLKRMLIRARHRAFGWMHAEGNFHLRAQLPSLYAGSLEAFDRESSAVLRALENVYLMEREPLQTVDQLVRAVSGTTAAMQQAELTW